MKDQGLVVTSEFIFLLHCRSYCMTRGKIPQMKDQGFAVSPGTQTLVGVQQYKVIFFS